MKAEKSGGRWEYWAAAQSGLDSQAMKLLAPSELQGEMRWPRLFSRLREAVEFTALQRGTERRSP